VYGNCCDVDAIDRVATERGWPVLYDAAHAFGTRWRGRSAMAFGAAATASFHATKVFHTAEGGAVVTANGDLADRVRRLRSFGEREKGDFAEVGINAKLSEAALLAAGVQGRRYFHPSLSTLPWVKRTPTPVADDAARRVLCLPLFHGLSDQDLDRICDVVSRSCGGAA
jgi:dTDP-4-amino-4,6-dideoxygalactose transaminase